VDALELEGWADRLIAREQLPEIVRLLIVGSAPELRRLDVRTGEGIGLPGWDGLADAVAGNPWVPEGVSAWEMGTDEDITTKANADYSHRTQDPLGLQPAETTFVFVTPRRWSHRDSWATTKRAEDIWKDVRAYDAESLTQWLDTAPAVHARVTRLLGRDPTGATDLASAWSTWAGQTAPALPRTLLTAGRDDEVKSIIDWLHAGPSALPVVADSQDEALAFIASCLLQLPLEEGTAVEARTLVIQTRAVWDEILARATTAMVLLPLFPTPAATAAVDAGHHVVLPLDRTAVTTGTTVFVSPLRHEPAKRALIEAGVAERSAEEWAALARRSLLMLQRRLAVNPTVVRPPWAQPDRARDVVALVLAGAWRDDSPADRDALAALVDRPYNELSGTLTEWANQVDPPVKAIGSLWFMTSKDDAWKLTAPYLTSTLVQRFRDRAVEVLGTIHPAMELEPERRWAAGILGKTLPWSSDLRRGLAEALALVATRAGDTPLPGGQTGQELADQIVRVVLAKANGDPSGQLWSSLTDALPTLAEASPEQFLDAVDVGLASVVLMRVFDPASEASPLASTTHTGLLWALEALAWSADYLSAAAVVLAQLAEREPGGSWANRPATSLREIFLPWSPHTSASLDERLAALDRLRQAVPAVASSLMLSLLPLPHDVSTPTYQPRWRGWEPEEKPSITFAQWWHHVDQVVERLIADAGSEGARWAELVGVVDNLPEGPHEAVVQGLHELDPSRLAEEDRLKLAAALRTKVTTHRRFPNANWVLPTAHVDRLAAELQRFDLADPVKGCMWLFQQHVELPSPVTHDFAAEHEAVKRAREQALHACLAAGGLEGVWKLASRCDVPRWVGYTLGQLDGDTDDVVHEHLMGTDLIRQQCAEGYVVGRFEARGWTWADAHLRKANAWPVEGIVRFLRWLPAQPETFDRAERLGNEIHDLYWENVPADQLWASSDRLRAVRMLLAHGRAAAAIPLLDSSVGASTTETKPATALVLQALAESTPSAAEAGTQMFGYHVRSLLTYLDADEDVDRTQLAQLEWRYLPLFRYQEWSPRVLQDELARNPDFFVEVISWVYRSDSQPPEPEFSEEARVRAVLGAQLLSSWRTPLGIDGHRTPTLADWVTATRVRLTGRGRIRVGDQRIGGLLRYVPIDPDGVWPTVAVREIVEAVASRDLELGIELEVMNSRGVTSRGPTEGGALERTLVNRYREYAHQIGNRWPRTRRMLQRIAESFERDARREDERAETVETFRS